MLRLPCRVCVQWQLHHDAVYLFRGVLQPINELEQLHGVNWHVYAVWRWTRVRRRRRATHALHLCRRRLLPCWLDGCYLFAVSARQLLYRRITGASGMSRGRVCGTVWVTHCGV